MESRPLLAKLKEEINELEQKNLTLKASISTSNNSKSPSKNLNLKYIKENYLKVSENYKKDIKRVRTFPIAIYR